MIPPRSEFLALLGTARESFDESVPLLVADWLEEHGDEDDRARAAWIRLWSEPERAAKPGREERRNAMEAAHGEAWIARLLSLHSNGLGGQGAIALARQEWPALEELYLTGCGIGAEGAAALAYAPGFPRLRVLTLGYNPLGNKGVMALTRGKGLPRLGDLDLDGLRLPEAAIAALRERYGPALRT